MSSIICLHFSETVSAIVKMHYICNSRRLRLVHIKCQRKWALKIRNIYLWINTGHLFVALPWRRHITKPYVVHRILNADLKYTGCDNDLYLLQTPSSIASPPNTSTHPISSVNGWRQHAFSHIPTRSDKRNTTYFSTIHAINLIGISCIWAHFAGISVLPYFEDDGRKQKRELAKHVFILWKKK